MNVLSSSSRLPLKCICRPNRQQTAALSLAAVREKFRPSHYIQKFREGVQNASTSFDGDVELPGPEQRQLLRADAARKGQGFDALGLVSKSRPVGSRFKAATEHRASTAKFKTSHRKLNELSRLIARQPVDAAILQMEMSDKRPAKRVKSMLAWARDLALSRGIRRERMIVDESWVAKGPKIKRVDIKGRGRAGVKEHSTTRLSVILREGKTKEELQQKAMDKDLKQRLRASAMHGLWMAKEAQPKIINMGARRGWLI